MDLAVARTLLLIVLLSGVTLLGSCGPSLSEPQNSVSTPTRQSSIASQADSSPSSALWQPPEPAAFNPSVPPPFIRYEENSPMGTTIVVEIGDYRQVVRRSGSVEEIFDQTIYPYHLHAVIDRANLFSLHDNYAASGDAGSVKHTITYTETGRSKVIEWDGKTETPVALVDLVADVRRVADLPILSGSQPNYGAPATITYDVFHRGPTEILQITAEGEARLYESPTDLRQLRLSDEQQAELTSIIASSDFFRFEVVQETPTALPARLPIPTAANDHRPYFGVLVTQGGMSRYLPCGISGSLTLLDALCAKLETLKEQVKLTGTILRAPETMIGYMLFGDKQTWIMNIDIEGGVHVNPYKHEGPSGYLSADELMQLVSLFDQAGFYDMKEFYAPLGDARDVTSERERRVLVAIDKGGKRVEVNAVSGASVPPGFRLILERLAEIHTRFQASEE